MVETGPMKGKLKLKEAATALGLSADYVRNICSPSQGTGPRHIKYAGRLYFDPKDVDAWVRAQSEVRQRKYG